MWLVKIGSRQQSVMIQTNFKYNLAMKDRNPRPYIIKDWTQDFR